MKKSIQTFIKILACTAALLTAAQISQADTDLSQVPLKSGILIPKATDLSSFKFQYLAPADDKSQNAKPKLVTKEFTNADLKGHWTLMFYGFTNCPALCPTSMAQLSNAYKIWAKDKDMVKNNTIPQVVFVSVDPERDTLQKVYDFATTFNPHFIGARTATTDKNDMDMLKKLMKETDAMFTKVAIAGKDKDPKSKYTINHTGDIVVICPNGKFVGLLTMPHDTDSIVADYKTILDTLKVPVTPAKS